MRVELVLDAHASLGECPVWSEREQALYWADINEPALHRFDPATGDDRKWTMPAQIGAFALCRSGRVLAALRTGLMRTALGADDSELLAPTPYDPRTHRFNEGKCDARGRFWVGTMYQPLQDVDGPVTRALPLHVYSLDDGLRAIDATAQTANGLGWSPNQRTMYFADTAARTIRRFDFDLATGTPSAPRTFAHFSDERYRPDGAAIDVEGGYWSALYGAGRVVRLDANGNIEREIVLSVSQPTMCAFGGSQMDTLYITTAAQKLDADARSRQPHAGGLFRCQPGVRGLPAHLFAD
ncbi:MAG: SMP-30/gluconolactonase/LRE family protein [Burkholderiaceae bacterium]